MKHGKKYVDSLKLIDKSKNMKQAKLSHSAYRQVRLSLMKLLKFM